MATPTSVAFHTLGCKLNFSETSSIRQSFEKKGYAVHTFQEPADLYVINTCSVTDFADRKCRKAVRQALRQNPEAKIIVMGCYAQLKPDEIANIPGVDLVLGAKEKFNILSYLDALGTSHDKGMVAAGEIQEVNQFQHSFSFGDRTRSFLKVQDGCDYQCSFCTIPMARGKSRSDTIDQVLQNAEKIGDLGVKEIVLTGINLGDFGNGTSVIEGERAKKEALFIDLMRALDQQGAVPRFRISSIEPNLCTDEIISYVAGSRRFMPHFHMPLQSGNDKQLRAMRRRYNTRFYADRVARIKKEIPHACIGVDVIVGFPGESEEDFLKTQTFINDLDISYLHVFTYSERDNTLAADMSSPVPVATRKNRNAQLRMVSEKKRRHFYFQHLGSNREVLFETSQKSGLMTGYTDNYIKVHCFGEGSLINKIQPVFLDHIKDNGVMYAERKQVEFF